MPETTLDCRKLECPQPIIHIKRLLATQTPDAITVLVDNEPAFENVTRFLRSRGYGASFSQGPDLWRITGVLEERRETALVTLEPVPATQPLGKSRTLLMLLSPVVGSGDDELGARLMKNFLAALTEMDDLPWRIVMLNGGVTMAADDSPVIEELRRLEKRGISILVCGACLEHFGLLRKKAVGQTTNMLDVVSSMQVADKILRV
ncbi:MAG: sulfurtransferase-like selenium metabolism protein YedF [Desulfovibrio sp.]|jgi:selenium metabolism protein YedF|nr:sulfurtransferase-like selenium metabolism protein YedF [Desulfovibrio sp.]